AQFGLEHVEDILVRLYGTHRHFAVCTPVMDLPPLQGHGLPRRDADETVTSDLLAAFHRFEQEAGAEAVHQLEIDADRRLQIGRKLAIDRDEVSRPARQSAEGVQVGPVEADLPGAAARPA